MENLGDLQTYLVLYTEKLIDFLPTLVGALALLIVGWWAIKFLLRYLKNLFIKKEYDLALQHFLLTVIGIVLKVLLLLMVISNLGIETTSFIAMLGAAGLAIGLALQGSLSNFAGGVIILILKPFRLGHWIEAQGVSGSVTEISLFYTKLTTFGNQQAIIPNGQLTNDNVINYTVLGRRMDALTFRITYDSDMKKAKEILSEILNEQKDILKDPAPQVLVSELAENSVNLSVRFWAQNETFWDCHWHTIEQAKLRLEAAGIQLPIQKDFNLYGGDTTLGQNSDNT